MKTYFGFGLAPSMFPGDVQIAKLQLSDDQARHVLAKGVVSCLNPSHKATIDVMEKYFEIKVEIPIKAPIVTLQPGERLLVMGVSGLPRLENRHEYTIEEVAKAEFTFSLWTVSS